MKLTEIIDKEYQEVKEEQIVPPVKNKITPGVEMLLQTFERELDYIEPHENAGRRYEFSTLFDLTVQSLSGIYLRKISSEEITEFAFLLPQFQKRSSFHIAGYFLSGLLFRHKQDTKYSGTYQIPIDHFEKPLEFFGLFNNANIHIIGSLGNYAFHSMSEGTVTIEGNTGKNLAVGMRGGSIDVYGNTGDFLGQNMSKGKVTIHGNVGRCVGTDIRGGTLEIKGNYQSLGPAINYLSPMRCHGTIIHQDKVIFHKGSWYQKIAGLFK